MRNLNYRQTYSTAQRRQSKKQRQRSDDRKWCKNFKTLNRGCQIIITQFLTQGAHKEVSPLQQMTNLKHDWQHCINCTRTREQQRDRRKIAENLKLFTLAESLGGVESLCCHPASMTHASIPHEERKNQD